MNRLKPFETGASASCDTCDRFLIEIELKLVQKFCSIQISYLKPMAWITRHLLHQPLAISQMNSNIYSIYWKTILYIRLFPCLHFILFINYMYLLEKRFLKLPNNYKSEVFPLRTYTYHIPPLNWTWTF